MESLILSLLSGELSVTTLLLLFIIAILTKRFVPWWVYDSLVAELEIYKKQAPALIDDIQELFSLIEDSHSPEHKKKVIKTMRDKAAETKKELTETNEHVDRKTRVRPQRTSGRRSRRND